MARKNIKPEKVFYDHITKLINNLLIDNPNYRNGYHSTVYDLITHTKERARCILQEMEQTKHLIDLD